MHRNGMVTLQPTTLALKQAPNVVATANFSHYPDELLIVLRHIPQPEHFGKVSNRPNYNTYHAFLINSIQNTKTLLGSIGKHRPGTYQLISQCIPTGNWDRLIISLAQGGSAELGLPLFEATVAAEIPETERFSTLPAITKINREACDISVQDKPLLQPGSVLPEPAITETFNTTADSLAGQNDTLLQPGTVLPEDMFYEKAPGHLPSPNQAIPSAASDFFDMRKVAEVQDGQLIQQITIPHLPNHACWLVNYQGCQLVGYVFDPSTPKKPLYIMHGVPGSYSNASKPEEKGYDYWITNPRGDGGYWLRYTNPADSAVMYPFPISKLEEN